MSKHKPKLSRWQKFSRKQPPEWYVWRGMKKRCYYSKHPSYHLYGGRGVIVCDRWLEHGTGFKNFMEDMGKRPDCKHDLDRKKADGHYTPENCRWLHQSINRNTRDSERYGQVATIIVDSALDEDFYNLQEYENYCLNGYPLE